MDDQYIIEEQAEIAAPSLTLSHLTPTLTNQVNACNDFEPMSNDTYMQAISRDKIARPDSSYDFNHKSDLSVDSANGFKSSSKIDRIALKRTSTIFVHSNLKNKKHS
jgi:hypothetical protein